MKRTLAFSTVLVFLAGTLGSFDPAWALTGYEPKLPITAGSALLIDAATQRVIYAKAPHVRRPPASTTKIMTALVVLDKLSLDQVVSIPIWVKQIEPSKVYLRPGERYRVRDLLHAALINSANDASEALAVRAAGSRTQFAQWMNAKARKIGCRNTHFVNASGLPPGYQYSTAYDLALIMREARKSAFLVDSLGRRYHTIQSLEGRRIHLRNHNRLLWRSQRSVIGKTGWTRKSRHCFVGRIKWKGREVLVALMASRRLWSDLKILLDFQFGVSLYKVRKNRKSWSTAETRLIQKALTRAGCSPGPVDGKWGPRTVRAVELFQKSQGLRPDGILGAATAKKLVPFGLPPSFSHS